MALMICTLCFIYHCSKLKELTASVRESESQNVKAAFQVTEIVNEIAIAW